LLEFKNASKASLVGARTVKGPGPLSVAAKSALVTAATKEDKSLLTATSTMVFVLLEIPSSSLLQE
jgi:hypothetical protein